MHASGSNGMLRSFCGRSRPGHNAASAFRRPKITLANPLIDSCQQHAGLLGELPTPVRAALVQAEKPEAEQRNLLAGNSLNGSEKKLYELLPVEEPIHID